jgi:hypothetical protein
MKAKTIFLVIIMLAVFRLAYAGIQCMGCGKMDPTSASDHNSGCIHGSKSGGSGNSGGSPEKQIIQGLLGPAIRSLFEGLFAPPPDTSIQDNIAGQKAIKQQQENEKKRLLGVQLWVDLQNREEDSKTIADTENQKTGQELLTQMGSVGGGRVPFKWETGKESGIQFQPIGTAGYNPTSGFSDAQFEEMSAAWMESQRKLIQQRLEEPNKWCSAIYKHLTMKEPPLPWKKLDELQAGDVLLIRGTKAITGVDNLLSSGDNASHASHTVSYLKEVNGVKLFLDNQPGKGPKIILEDEFLKEYGPRGAEVAKLAQPLNAKEAKQLFEAAEKMADKNSKEIADNWFVTPLLGTNYGAWGKENVVCSEADWALINATGRNIPKSGDRMKVGLGIDFSPADFYNNEQYFLVTPFW